MSATTFNNVPQAPFYQFEFPVGCLVNFDSMKDVKKYLNSDDYQDDIQNFGGCPTLWYFRVGEYQPCRLSYDKWIEKD